MRLLALLALLALVSCSTPENGARGSEVVFSTCLKTDSTLDTGMDVNGNMSTTVSTVCTSEEEIQVDYAYFNGVKHINKIYLLNNGKIVKEIVNK
jgi:uncharacterized protein YcfL